MLTFSSRFKRHIQACLHYLSIRWINSLLNQTVKGRIWAICIPPLPAHFISPRMNKLMCCQGILWRRHAPEALHEGPREAGIGQRRGCHDRINVPRGPAFRYGVASSFGRHCSALGRASLITPYFYFMHSRVRVAESGSPPKYFFRHSSKISRW